MGASARRFDGQRSEPLRSTNRCYDPQEFDFSRNDCGARRSSNAIYSLFLFLTEIFPMYVFVDNLIDGLRKFAIVLNFCSPENTLAKKRGSMW